MICQVLNATVIVDGDRPMLVDGRRVFEVTGIVMVPGQLVSNGMVRRGLYVGK